MSTRCGDLVPGWTNYHLGRVMVEDCEDDHGCCCECDGCEGGTYEDLEGPVPPPLLGPHPMTLSDMLIMSYERKLYGYG